MRSDYKADWSHVAATNHYESVKKKIVKGKASMDQDEDDDDGHLSPSKDVVVPIFQHKKKVS